MLPSVCDELASRKLNNNLKDNSVHFNTDVRMELLSLVNSLKVAEGKWTGHSIALSYLNHLLKKKRINNFYIGQLASSIQYSYCIEFPYEGNGLVELSNSIYFIRTCSSKINACLKWIKAIFSRVKWYRINSQVSDTIYIFTVKIENCKHKYLLKDLLSNILMKYDTLDVNVSLSYQRHILRWRNAFSARDVRRTANTNGFLYSLTSCDAFIKMTFCTIF